MIYLLERNQIISHSVNKSERHPALSEIAKFISLSIVNAISCQLCKLKSVKATCNWMKLHIFVKHNEMTCLEQNP